MKKCFVGFLLLQLMMVVHVYAQTAKIIDVGGEVVVRQDATDSWRKATIGMYVEGDSEVKTAADSYCTLAFDEELENVLTLKENSHIKIEDVRPTAIFLPQGRVFSLIDNVARLETFEIRTPTLIAGVRGTGWLVESKKKEAPSDCFWVKCFQEYVSVHAVDKEGKKLDEEDLPEGFGVGVCSDGKKGDLFPLKGSDYDEWDDFMEYLKGLRGDAGRDYDDALGNLKDEQKNDFGDGTFEDRRSDGEKGGGDSGSRNGNGDYGD